jgi:hypothetical protein
MIKKKTNEKKCLADNRSGAKFARLMRPFDGVQTMHTDPIITLQIKEDSP